MVQRSILTPDVIEVTEKFVYESKISGVRHMSLIATSGLIKVVVPFDKRKHFNVARKTYDSRRHTSTELLNGLLAAEIGSLHIDNYGRSNLSNQSHGYRDPNVMSLKPSITEQDLTASNIQNVNRFDLRLTHTYQPEEPKYVPLTVGVHIIDEDVINQHEPNLVDQLTNQAGLKHSLIMEFWVLVTLPGYVGSQYQRKSLEISRMTLTWPIATPHRLAALHAGSSDHRPIRYNPERGEIEWRNIPLTRRGEDKQTNTYTFALADWIWLEVRDPVELYQALELNGSVTIEVDGLYSNLQLTYDNPKATLAHFTQTYRTVFTNEFKLNLEEGLNRKTFSPRQLLYFPGIVLDELRIADILMLLEDQGFRLRNRPELLEGPDHQSPSATGGMNPDESPQTKRYIIEAERNEGAKKLTLYMLLYGTDARTTRERKARGAAKYKTSLPTGDTVIDIRGQLHGDSKRVVSVINEIQKRLKEQFQHVGTAE